jgi:hypothetical protein
VPRKSGKITPQETAFARAYAATADRALSGVAARYARPLEAADRNLAKPAVLAEIAREQTARLFNEALPAAVNCLVEVITNSKAPAGARVQAAKVVMDRTLGDAGAGQSKEPHEMTAEELTQAIERLEQVASGRAKPVAQPAEGDVFG